MGELSQLLSRAAEGNERALEELIEKVYVELRQMATRHLARERSDHTLQPTALIHEVYLRLLGTSRPSFTDRAHFFGACAATMRRILVDHARAKKAAKRGGGVTLLALDEEGVVPHRNAPSTVDLLALDRALDRLDRLDARQRRVIELRFFAGLSIAEAAEVMSLSIRTIKLEWTKARAWLFHELGRA